jgi:hypothetical protein
MKNIILKNSIRFLLIILFFIGFFGTVLNAAWALIASVTIPYTIIIFALSLYILSAVLLNNYRISKIRKELCISREEYDDLVTLFYPTVYPENGLFQSIIVIKDFIVTIWMNFIDIFKK